jgi:hypothetical protein
VLKHFREQVVRVWRKWLGRRSQRARMTWDRMRQLLERNPLPRARGPIPPRSESVSRRAGCGNSARPDPWGPREGNLPRLPELGTKCDRIGVTEDEDLNSSRS